MSLKISRNIDPIENEIGKDKFVLDLSDHIIYVTSVTYLIVPCIHKYPKCIQPEMSWLFFVCDTIEPFC